PQLELPVIPSEVEGPRRTSSDKPRGPSSPQRSAQDDTRPVFTRSSRIPRMRFCTLELERKASTVFCIRRLQLDFAAVPGTLNRSLRARRSVIITMAIQALLWNNALIIAG